jgi:hypothetical protein
MAKFKEKISPFIFGVTVGLLIASAAFIFKLDEYIRNFQFREKSRETIEESTITQSNTTEKQSEKSRAGKNEVGNKNQSSKKSNSTSSFTDSLVSENYAFISNEENVNVLKEELVGIKNVRIKTEQDKLTSKKDSALGAIAGIEEKASGDFLIIEFWKTPLNSKGYRMSRNKIVLYGLPEQELEVIKLDDAFYLRNGFGIFKLVYSNEFKKMEPVSESSIIARLN